MHNKRLMYTVRVGAPDPKLANLILEQFGGPDGELAAAMRYFTQGLAEIDPGRKDLLLDIATEESSHLEVVGSIVTMLNQGVKGQMADGLGAAELLANISGGTDSPPLRCSTAVEPRLPIRQASPRPPLMSTRAPSRLRISAPTPPRRGPKSFTSGSSSSATTPT
jgi:Manganese containing catalase